MDNKVHVPFVWGGKDDTVIVFHRDAGKKTV